MSERYEAHIFRWWMHREFDVDTPAVENLERRVDRLEAELNFTKGMMEGQKVRVDRILGTVEDLLKRFEAWKQVGNEMGQTVDGVVELQKTHDEMWKHQQEANTVASKFMEETKKLLEKLLGELQLEGQR